MDLTDIAMYCKSKQSEREADKYKQQSDLYESVLTGTVTEFVVPSENKHLKNISTGEVYEDEIYLAKSLKAEDFIEISEEEYQRIKAEVVDNYE